LVSIYLFNKI